MAPEVKRGESCRMDGAAEQMADGMTGQVARGTGGVFGLANPHPVVVEPVTVARPKLGKG